MFERIPFLKPKGKKQTTLLSATLTAIASDSLDESTKEESYFSSYSERNSIKDDKNLLESHKITEEERTKMVDWLILVTRVIKELSKKTFFLTIQIMDQYFRICS